MAKVERDADLGFGARRLGKNGRCLVVIPNTSSHRWLPKSAPPSSSRHPSSSQPSPPALWPSPPALSMAVGVISIMRASPEQVTSALQVGTPLAQAVGKEGLGGVAAAGKEGLGVVAADEKEGLL